MNASPASRIASGCPGNVRRASRSPSSATDGGEDRRTIGWEILRDNGREEVAGLCPLHRETRPSFYVNRRKQVFYCHGCGRGGGLARLIRWLDPPPESVPDRTAEAQRRGARVFIQTRLSMGSHLNPEQLSQLCQPGKRAVYICFDADRNGGGQRAARSLSIQLRDAGVEALRVELPRGHDPASLFAAGAGPDFQRCLDEARP